MSEVVRQAVAEVVEGRSLSREAAKRVMAEIMAGRASEALIAALLVGLRMKGETAEEIAGFAEAMREAAVRVECRRSDVIDTCGTGGDAHDTFNISTAAAIVAAAAGAAVAKHGNRAVSSRCGSADVLEALGVVIELGPGEVAECIDRTGFGFLYAPGLHPAMKHAMPVRRELKVRTVFNLLGPLTNPAGARRQVLGVFSRRWVRPVAEALAELGADRALVVHGLEGLDEISVCGPTAVAELRDGEVSERVLEPEELGLGRHELCELAGAGPEESAQMIVAVFEGQRGARRDAVVANAAAALYVAGMADDLSECARMAEEVIDSGAALRKLEEIVRFSRELGGRGEGESGAG